MSVLNNFTKKFSETAKAAAKKSGDIVEVTKMSMSINSEESKIEEAFEEVGRALYDAYQKGSEVPEEVKEICQKIDEYEENIKELKAKILELKNVKSCPGCGTELPIETAFCPKCGAKQEMSQPEPPAEEPKEKTCPNCNIVIGSEDVFCPKCGTRL